MESSENASKQNFVFDSVESALAEIKAGRLVVVVDDEGRENEGDLIGAAQFTTPDTINFMAVHGRGLICLAVMGDRLDQLNLPLMVTNNTESNQAGAPITWTSNSVPLISRTQDTSLWHTVFANKR